MSTNTVVIEGNLGRDAETRAFQSGARVVSFAIGVTRRYKAADGSDREETSWIDCKAFGRLADDNASLGKGERVIVIGELRQETWQDKQTGANRSRLVVAASAIARVERRQQAQDNGGYGQPYGGMPPQSYQQYHQQAQNPPRGYVAQSQYAPQHPVDDADLPPSQVEPDTPF